jgi:adenylate cyclase
MAVFGSLEEEADSEFRAVAAALEFQSAIKDMNEERQRLGKESISIGVGLNTGNLSMLKVRRSTGRICG